MATVSVGSISFLRSIATEAQSFQRCAGLHHCVLSARRCAQAR
jgi:hypothetical protein